MPTKTIQKKDIDDLKKIIDKLDELCSPTRECTIYTVIGCYACPFTTENGNCGLRVGMMNLRDIKEGLRVKM